MRETFAIVSSARTRVGPSTEGNRYVEAATRRVRPSNEAAAAEEHRLADIVRTQAHKIMQTPYEALQRQKVDEDLREAKPHRMTMIAFVDMVHRQLLSISPANRKHAEWLHRQFIRG